jgi:hypothetical protein
MIHLPVIDSPGEDPGSGRPGRAAVSPSALPRSGRCRPLLRPRPSRGISAKRASKPPRSWWSRPPRVGTWGFALPASRRRQWRRSRCSRRWRASRPSGIRFATRTGWQPLVLPRGPCRPGGIAASRPRPPGSARVEATGYGGVRTRRRDTRRCRAAGPVHRPAAARGMALASAYPLFVCPVPAGSTAGAAVARPARAPTPRGRG